MWNKIRSLFEIHSLTTRVRLAFLSIILLLLFSGIMSLQELERVSADTEEILMASKSNADLAGDMLDALNKQNNAIVYMAIEGEGIEHHRKSCEEGISELYKTTLRAQEIVQNTETPNAADELIACANRLNNLSMMFLNGEVKNELIAKVDNPDDFMAETIEVDGELVTKLITPSPTTNIPTRYSAHKWYIETYQTEYLNMSSEITKYMTGSHTTLGPEVNNLSHTARRAVTPVSITLIVIIAIVLMFHFFFMVYIVKPIQRIDRSLGAYLTYKMPFDDGIRSRDEIRGVRDKIAALISKIR